MSFSFTYMPGEDRIAMTICSAAVERSVECVLTRKMVKNLGNYLRNHREDHSMPAGAVQHADKKKALEIVHRQKVHSANPRWSSEPQSQNTKAMPFSNGSKLPTHIRIHSSSNSMIMKWYDGANHFMTLSLNSTQIHIFLFSLAEISAKADWDLQHVFEWAGDTEGLDKTQAAHNVH